jgi:hypothetical protein
MKEAAEDNLVFQMSGAPSAVPRTGGPAGLTGLEEPSCCVPIGLGSEEAAQSAISEVADGIQSASQGISDAYR